MIQVFHGDNQLASKNALDSYLASKPNVQIYRYNSKDIDPNTLNLVLNSTSLLDDTKIIVISNFFSITKSTLDKLTPLLKQTTIDIAIWQDKLLTVTQLKIFPTIKNNQFKADNIVFKCLNSITPKNTTNFNLTYQKVINENMFDLFLYLIKGSFRRQLTSYSKFPLPQLKKSYLQIIELEYLYKSGQLPLSKDIALERIILNLIR